MVEFLANDEVQYCLLRIPVSKDGIDHHRDVFVYWSGPNVSIIQRGKLKTHLGAVQKVLRVSVTSVPLSTYHVLTKCLAFPC